MATRAQLISKSYAAVFLRLRQRQCVWLEEASVFMGPSKLSLKRRSTFELGDNLLRQLD